MNFREFVERFAGQPLLTEREKNIIDVALGIATGEGWWSMEDEDAPEESEIMMIKAKLEELQS